VLNASPLIVLAHVGQQRLLLELPEQVVVPRAVVEEILAGPTDDPARHLIEEGYFKTVEVPPSPEVIAWDLGAGETAVLSFALRTPGWTVILDDAAARKCARSFGLSLKGTLAVILRAKQKGLIPSAVEVLHELRAIGFRLDDDIIRKALDGTTGESW
jgi:predicted nucleic acid-binding protein